MAQSISIRPKVPDKIVGKEGAKQGGNKDLQAETGEGQIESTLVGACGLGRQGSTDRLKNQAYDVGWNKDPVEEVRFETGQLRRDVLDTADENEQIVAEIERGENTYAIEMVT